MAIEIAKANAGQQDLINKIIAAGKKIGTPDVVIQAAINIANAESGFVVKPAPNTSSSAQGMFQYIDASWSAAWNNYVKANPNDPLAQKSASEARFNADAQIVVMYQDLNKWYAGYDQGVLAKIYLPGGDRYSDVLALKASGIDVTTNFLSYAYLRHNTSASETSLVINRDFTTANLNASSALIQAQPASSKKISFSTSADGLTITMTTKDANGNTLASDVQSYADSNRDTLVSEISTTYKNGVVDQQYVVKNGQRYNTANLNDALQIDALRNNNQLGAISGALAQQMNRAISNTLTSAPTSTLDLGPYNPNKFNPSITVECPGLPNNNCDSTLSLAPIGAFYEAKSAALDKALSIADKTGVLIGANNKGMTTAALQALDTNHDGKLSGTELAGLQVWTDSNENGTLDAGEIKTLDSAGINQVAGTDYSFYTKGNSTFGINPVTAIPAQVNLIQGVPSSNYRTLRDTDNRYMVNSSQWIDFGANQVKINNSNRTFLIGTDGSDNFDANYYAAYSQFVNSNLLTNFLAGAGDDVMGGSSRNDNLWGGTGNDTLLGYAGDDKLYGEEGNDQLQGGADNDYLDGGVGNDTLFGQVGNDTLVGGDGDDLLVGFTASNEAKQTLLAGETDNDYLYGGNGNDQLYGGLGNDYLDGGVGNDLLIAGDGDDILFGGAGINSGDDELNGGTGNDQLSGDAGNDKIFGGVGNDLLWGGDGNDILVGFNPTNDAQQTLLADQLDNDVMYGGAGDDLMLGGLGDDQLFGGLGVDEIQAGVGNDALYGEGGNDRLFGGAGNDTIYGGAGDDLVVGGVASNETALVAGTADSNFLYGGDGNDTILGGIGNDYIDGGAGADNMQGGQGDDTYIVNSVNDVILEFANQGYDTVVSSSNYILNSNIEELRLVEGFNVNGTGNSLDNLITGNSSDNILDGVTGLDTMIGGLGNDTYYVDNIGDKVVENANEGIDTAQSKISYTLGNNVENVNLLDFGKAEKGLVDGQAVLVYGYPKANELDYMQGDAVANYKGTCALTSIANLLTQAKTPTTEAQVVSLAIANNWAVTSTTATDYQRGGSNYLQQQALLSSYGTDNALISGYNEQGVANLIRSGRGVIMAVNAGKLWGDANYLDNGGVNHVVTVTGAVYGESDGILQGFYIADSGRQLVSDMTRFVSITDFRAAANVPSSYAIYTTAAGKLWDENINATGNSLDNTIIGNRGNNILNGLAGNDSLIGGLGNDTYVFGLSSGTDTIVDTDSTVGNVDTISVAAGVVKEQLWFSQSGNDLVMAIIGTGDKSIIKDWYAVGTAGASTTQNQIEQITLSNGNTLANTQVNSLVQAMAAYTPPAMGVTTLSPTYQASLATVIANSWA